MVVFPSVTVLGGGMINFILTVGLRRSRHGQPQPLEVVLTLALVVVVGGGAWPDSGREPPAAKVGLEPPAALDLSTLD